jgi:hypothetical protein
VENYKNLQSGKSVYRLELERGTSRIQIRSATDSIIKFGLMSIYLFIIHSIDPIRK